MTKQAILPNKEYAFHDFFKLKVDAAIILNHFGYSKSDEVLNLPRSSCDLPNFDDFKLRLKDVFRCVELDGERARREFLIAPVIAKVAGASKARLMTERWLEFDSQLKGYLSYLLNNGESFIAVEGTTPFIKSRQFYKSKTLIKSERISNFNGALNQMFVQLMALDKLLENANSFLYGVVTTGNVWQFVILDREQKRFTQDSRIYDLSSEAEDIIRILAGILERQ